MIAATGSYVATVIVHRPFTLPATRALRGSGERDRDDSAGRGGGEGEGIFSESFQTLPSSVAAARRAKSVPHLQPGSPTGPTGAKGERTCASSEKTFRSDASDPSHRRDARRSLPSPPPPSGEGTTAAGRLCNFNCALTTVQLDDGRPVQAAVSAGRIPH